jgi:anti-anti-sigma factor
MRIIQRMFGEAVALDIIDEFTYGARKEFTSTVDRVKHAGCRHLILNFDQVTFVDSAAIGLLALAAQQFKLEDRKLSMVSPQGTVKQILELANIHTMIPVFPSEDAVVSDKGV